jgi:hypothetical protein
MQVVEFFARCAALAMGDDDRAMAGLYAPSFFVGGPKGSMTFPNDARFLDWLAQVRAFNRQHGMRALSPAAGARFVVKAVRDGLRSRQA